jgi:hypothetical protein
MSEYARRNLVCSSWHKCPEGWQSWTGMSHGYSTRPFCDGPVGHAGDHETTIEAVGDANEVKDMTWPNTIGMPYWLIQTAIHALTVAQEHLGERDADGRDVEAAVGPAIDLLVDMRERQA